MSGHPRTRPIDPRVDIGHVHLKVADLDRSLAFYRDVLGFEVKQRHGDQAAFLAAGGGRRHRDAHPAARPRVAAARSRSRDSLTPEERRERREPPHAT